MHHYWVRRGNTLMEGLKGCDFRSFLNQYLFHRQMKDFSCVRSF